VIISNIPVIFMTVFDIDTYDALACIVFTEIGEFTHNASSEWETLEELVDAGL